MVRAAGLQLAKRGSSSGEGNSYKAREERKGDVGTMRGRFTNKQARQVGVNRRESQDRNTQTGLCRHLSAARLAFDPNHSAEPGAVDVVQCWCARSASQQPLHVARTRVRCHAFNHSDTISQEGMAQMTVPVWLKVRQGHGQAEGRSETGDDLAQHDSGYL